jgi:hypothetical protein
MEVVLRAQRLHGEERSLLRALLVWQALRRLRRCLLVSRSLPVSDVAAAVSLRW